MKWLLARYLEKKPKKVELMYSIWGKPYIKEKKFLRFNIFHSKAYALYAITRDQEIGIDLEYIDKMLDLESMATFIFSISELRHWKELNSEDKLRIFLLNGFLKKLS